MGGVYGWRPRERIVSRMRATCPVGSSQVRRAGEVYVEARAVAVITPTGKVRLNAG